jgi:hypothetical protein
MFQVTKQVLKQTTTLNDNKTYDITSISFGLVVVVGCFMFGWATIALELPPDYLTFFGGIAAVVGAYGFSKSKNIDPDPTKIPKE